MNDCNAMQIKFTEYLDGLLSGREMQSVAAHMKQCHACARTGDLWRRCRPRWPRWVRA